jgi:predicted nucleic-acid-binding protein
MKPPAKLYLIDTNVILRYLLGDHKTFSPKAKAFMELVSHGTKKAEIPPVVIVECIYVMERFYKVPRSEIVETLTKILNFSGVVNSDKSEILEALLKFAGTTIDIVDCILAAQSSPEKVIISFDKDFDKLNAISETI